MGSANINDRSQKVASSWVDSNQVSDQSLQGDGDSEIALVVEDTDLVDTYMNGHPYNASRFAATLRRQLYKGHNPSCSSTPTSLKKKIIFLRASWSDPTSALR